LVPAAVLKDESYLPAGTRMFGAALAEADRVTLAFGLKDDRIEASLEARCKNDERARQAMRELQASTTLLNRMIAREKQTPNPRDLSGVLTKGEFRTEGPKVIGTWPIERVFLESLGGAP